MVFPDEGATYLKGQQMSSILQVRPQTPAADYSEQETGLPSMETVKRAVKADVSRRALLMSMVSAAVATRRYSGETASAQEAFAGVELPPDVGQTGLQVYVPDTGHTIRGTFLDYWRANGAASVFGNPKSEPFAAVNGYYSQAFERGILQFRPEFIWSDEPTVRLMPISDVLAGSGASGRPRRDGRRAAGGGYRRPSTWRPVSPDSGTAAKAINAGDLYFEETGHTVTGDIREFYEAHEGIFYLGYPMGQVYRQRGTRTQVFEGGMIVNSDAGTRLAALDRKVFDGLGIETAPVEQGDLPEYSESLFLTVNNPNPLGDLASPGRKWVEISISQQTLWAYQGGTVVTSSLVSTGLAPNYTELGLFHIRLKFPSQDMKGFTDSTGEVLASDSGGDGAVPYAVDDVPNVMYFNLDAEALHGAYWHNNFGNPMSHGCVNLPLGFAEFMFGWAPLGTMVWVHE